MSEKIELLTEESLGGYTRIEVIARLFGVTTRRIQQLTQDGTIKSEKIAGYNGRLYNVAECVRMYTDFLNNKAKGRGKTDTEIELKQQKLKAEIRLKESQGELHQLKTDLASNKYISKEEVKLDYSQFFTVFKKFALGLPGRVVGKLGNLIRPEEARKLEHELQEDVTNQLREFVMSAVEIGPEDDEKV